MTIPDFDDPSKRRDERKAAAKKAAPAMTEERRRILLAAEAASRTTSKPTRQKSTAPNYGTMDAVSLPIYEEHGPEPFMTGHSNDWLFLNGDGQSYGSNGSMPRQLRQGGSIYLRAGNHLVARVRYKGVETRTERIEHIASPTGFENRGPGNVLAVDPDTWERCNIELTSPSEAGMGYRYYMMDGDRPIWTPIGG